MPYFAYSARTKSGEKQSGKLEAPDRAVAVRRLEQSGLIPISIKESAGITIKEPEKKKGKGFRFESGFSFKPRMKSREVLQFTMELSDLLASGMKLGNALHTLSGRESGKAQDAIIAALRNEIVQGTALSDALKMFPETFTPLYINMVKAGEAGGALSETLESLRDHYERSEEAKSKVVTALVYPAFVLAIGFLSILFITLFIIPTFSKTFEELGAALPAPTELLIRTSRFLLGYGWLLALFIAGGIILFRRFIRTPKGRFWWHGHLLHMPVIRNLVEAAAFSNFSRTLATLINNGVPILRALTIVENTVSNAVIAKEISSARERVTDGASISGPLAAGEIFPRVLTDMLAVGEKSGDLAGSLKHITRRYEQQLNQSVKIFTNILEPLMIVLMALIIGFIAISMLLPVFNLTSSLQA